MRFIKFTVRLGTSLPEPKVTPCLLQARLDGSPKWRTLRTFPLYLGHVKSPGVYITYRNSDVPCDGEPQVTMEAWAQVAKTRGLTASWVDQT